MNDPTAERPSPALGDLQTSAEADEVVFVKADRPDTPEEPGSGVEARLDSPHSPGKLPTPHGPGVLLGVQTDTEGEGEAPADVPDEMDWDLVSAESAPLPEKWRRHARELAQYLRRRQRDLDEREARLNSDAAKLEQEDRLLRLLWSQRVEEWEEKRLELARREAELDHRESTLRRREEELEGWAASMRLREEVLDQREYQIGLGEFDLANRRREWEDRVRAFEEHNRDMEALAAVLVPAAEPIPTGDESRAEPGPDARPSREMRREESVAGDWGSGSAPDLPPAEGQVCEDPRRRERSLAEVEAQSNHVRHRAEDLLRSLEEDREKLRQESRDLRHRWATLERQLLADWTARNRALLEREEKLRTTASKNQALLEAAQSLHRQALEHRAAAEEVLARLANRASQEFIRKKLAEWRRALKAAYQEQVDAADQKLAECRRIYRETLALQEAVAAQWRQHEAAWTERRKELWNQSQELTQREEELRLAEHDWRLERRKYETVELRLVTEIHRLRERLREAGSPASD